MVSLTVISTSSFINSSRQLQLRATRPLKVHWDVVRRRYCTPKGTPGAGADKSSGIAGDRSTGTLSGRSGSANEESYFHLQEKEKLSKVKKQLLDPNLTLKKKK